MDTEGLHNLEPLVTTKELAKLLHTNPARINQLALLGEIPTVPIPGSSWRRFQYSEVLKALKARHRQEV